MPAITSSFGSFSKQGAIMKISNAKPKPQKSSRKKERKKKYKIISSNSRKTPHCAWFFEDWGISSYRISGAVVLTTTPNRFVSLKRKEKKTRLASIVTRLGLQRMLCQYIKHAPRSLKITVLNSCSNNPLILLI